MVRRTLLILPVLLLGGLLLIQLIPYGRDHTNPPVRQEPAWDSEQTRALAQRACFDCHSNETEWLWYHNIAPISWGVQWDVEQGRERLNFSEWDRRQDKAEEAAEVVAEGEMPPLRYLLAHPSAALSPEEEEALIVGLLATFGGDADKVGEGIRDQLNLSEEELEALEELNEGEEPDALDEEGADEDGDGSGRGRGRGRGRGGDGE